MSEAERALDRMMRAALPGYTAFREHAHDYDTIRAALREAPVVGHEGWIWDAWGWEGEDPDMRPSLAWKHQEHHPGAKPCTVIIHAPPAPSSGS